MLTQDILNTKLFIPPARPVRVLRPRLIDQLNAGLHHKLIVISAPAGFGKTTLGSEWLNSLGSDPSSTKQKINRIAWLSLDEGDNDVAGFLTYFIAALSRAEGIESNFGEGALALLQSLQPPPVGDVLTSLINEIAAIPDRMILVIDDYSP